MWRIEKNMIEPIMQESLKMPFDCLKRMKLVDQACHYLGYVSGFLGGVFGRRP